MSWPSHGRDSHHETRVMRDDVMSYGDGDAVSAITLASFEDMGHYLARYGALDGKKRAATNGCKASGYAAMLWWICSSYAEIWMTLADLV